jgi:hypothetical protein
MQGNNPMSNQARVSNGLLWVFIALYVLMGAARLLHDPHLQRLTPFISVAILMHIHSRRQLFPNAVMAASRVCSGNAGWGNQHQ